MTARRIVRPCLEPSCGVPTGNPGGRCPECTAARQAATDARRGTHTKRGYDARWERLSRRAIALSPVCEDCGHTGSWENPLTADHARWPARSLADVAGVVCRRCNARRGAARGPRARTRATSSDEGATVPRPRGVTLARPLPDPAPSPEPRYTPPPATTRSHTLTLSESGLDRHRRLTSAALGLIRARLLGDGEWTAALLDEVPPADRFDLLGVLVTVAARLALDTAGAEALAHLDQLQAEAFRTGEEDEDKDADEDPAA